MNESDKMSRHQCRTTAFCCVTALISLFFALGIFTGTVDIPAKGVVGALIGRSNNEVWQFIVMESRLTQAVTALLCGAGLSAAGLMLQTCFANPLADTSILGVNAGASLGVALVFLVLGGGFAVNSFSVSGFSLLLAAAFAGAATVLAMLSMFATILRSNLMLLIAGIMVSYITSAIINLLSSFATAEGVHSYIFWGMGNFGGVPFEMLPAFAIIMIMGLIGAVSLVKPLDAMLLGDDYAANLGISIRNARLKILIVTGVLGATVTAFCGPVAFLGLAVPHVARFAIRTTSHRLLMPFTMMCGAAVALICSFICNLSVGNTFVPLNVLTSLWGVPVILYVLFFNRRHSALH